MNPGVSVEFKNVGKRFAKQVVLRDLNLNVESGEFVAVVGKSGSGKSTLLRLLTGLDQPDAGEIRIDYKIHHGECDDARMMFQENRLLPWMRVAQNVAMAIPSADDAYVNELLQAVGLADRANDWPAKLSGGQKQRVSLARALASRPRLLLLDEPLGSLDALTRLEMQRLIEDLWSQSGMTGILITHDVTEAVSLADRVVLLEDGIIAGGWNVNLSRPRDPTSVEFAILVRDILQRLAPGSKSHF